ncbi:MAG: sugar phosphate isomerase/epimerase [Deltaproteobacteria bacterium]|nr:sugar phosphate isomerase/epimerase [Deltaproteobacteria bacterium]
MSWNETFNNEVPVGMEQIVPGPLNYADCLDFARKNGFRWVEFKYEPDFMDVPGKAELDRIRRDLDLARIGCSVHATYHNRENLGAVDDEIYHRSLRLTRESLRFASDMGANFLTLHPGDAPKEHGEDPVWDLCRRRTWEAVSGLADEAEKLGVVIAVENRNGCDPLLRKYGKTPEELLEIRKAADGRVLFTLDWGHVLTTGQDPLEFARALGYHNLGLCHIHTNNGRDDLHLPLGRDDHSFRVFLEEYMETGLSVPLNVESKNLSDLLSGAREITAAWKEINGE